MNKETNNVSQRLTGRRFGRLLIVLVGIVVGQVILYGPSLSGRKILLPLDILEEPYVYLPMSPETRQNPPHDRALIDLVVQWELARQQAVSELHAGHFPMWTANQYAGAPVIWPKFSPFLLLNYSVATPNILAWTQLFAAMVAGLGAYLFCRRVLAVSFWAAAIPAWCYPLTGFFVFWQGYPTCGAVYWFPWLLLMVDRTVRGTSLFAPLGLSVMTGLTLVSGALDVAGQVLLISGLYAIWCWLDAYGRHYFRRQAQRAIILVGTGWFFGFLLAAPYLLPLVEYAQTGARMERRSAGDEERPPTGLSALPQTVLPDMYGTTQSGSLRITKSNQIESSAAAYTGVLATLFVAPLAWCSRRHRSINILWYVLVFFALSWCLNVPGFVSILRLPGLNMMSHNRLVFAASFAIIAMTAVGLDVLLRGEIRWRWFWLPAGLLTGLLGWCVYRAIFLPEPIATQLEEAINQGKQIGWIHNLDDVREVQDWFTQSYAVSAMLCGAGIIGWLLLWVRPAWCIRMVPVVGIFLVGDLLWFAHDRSAQCDPALYYPRIPVLEQIAKSVPGRVVGYLCLPATLAETHGLRDIRGYDAVDPARLMDIMAIAADPHSVKYPYAQTQWFMPRLDFMPPDGVRLSPILDMLDVRYVIFRGTPPPEIHPPFLGNDYWALVNSNALPRVFVPSHVEIITDDRQRLEKLASPQFDPRETAYVESPVRLPDSCRGSVKIVSEISTRVTLSAKMETAGLVVLADLWDQGWRVYLNGQPAPILRVNHAVRGVILPAGDTTLEFRYEPASFAWGLRLAGLAAVILVGWLTMAIVLEQKRKARANSPANPGARFTN